MFHFPILNIWKVLMLGQTSYQDYEISTDSFNYQD